jgi:two-component system phosphate regulon response regulator PhoB
MVTQARDLQRGMHGSASVLRAEHQIRHNAHVRQAEAREVAVRPIVIIMNENVASLVSYILEEEGLVTATAADIVAGAALADRNRACLTILDTDVLGRKQLIEQAIAPLLTTPSAPLLILTGAAEDLRRQLGRSPFIKIAQKPLPTAVLLGQIRGHMAAAGRTSELHFADVAVSLRTCRILRGSRRVHVSPTQFRMLCHLVRYPGQIISREDLIEAVWNGDAMIDPRTIDAHIVHLRKALTDGGERNVIQTVRSAGYMLDFDN